jgi:hypothetical protein
LGQWLVYAFIAMLLLTIEPIDYFFSMWIVIISITLFFFRPWLMFDFVTALLPVNETINCFFSKWSVTNFMLLI